ARIPDQQAQGIEEQRRVLRRDEHLKRISPPTQPSRIKGEGFFLLSPAVQPAGFPRRGIPSARRLLTSRRFHLDEAAKMRIATMGFVGALALVAVTAANAAPSVPAPADAAGAFTRTSGVVACRTATAITGPIGSGTVSMAAAMAMSRGTGRRRPITSPTS